MSVGTPHAARAAIIWNSLSDLQSCENTFYLQDSSDAIFTNPAATVAAIWTAWLAHGVPATDPNVQYVAVIFEDVRTVPFGGIEVPQTPTLGSRAIGGSVMPSNCCKAVKKSTGTLGRSGRGRWFFPVLSHDAYQTGDTFFPSTLAAITTGLSSFQTALEAALSPATMGIVSYRHAGAPRVAGLFEHITAWGTDNPDVDTQRRRLLGHNRHR